MVRGVKSVASNETVAITTTMNALRESARSEWFRAHCEPDKVVTLSQIPRPRTAVLETAVAQPIHGRHDTPAANNVVARGIAKIARISISRVAPSFRSIDRC